MQVDKKEDKEMKKPMQVLLVEDSPADVCIASEALVDTGIQADLFVVNDGDEAIKYLTGQAPYTKAVKPDVVLLDLNMPKVNGHQVLDEIRHVRGMTEIPIVLLTASDNFDDIDRAHHKGMNYYLRKPVEARCLASLLEVVRSLWNCQCA